MLIDKLKSLKSPTYQEKNIIDYILENPKAVEQSSAVELAETTFTSPSTVVRLCKKLGTKGYPDFKIRWIHESYSIEQEIYVDTSTDFIDKGISVISTIEIMPKVYNRILYETNQLIDKIAFQRILRIIKQTDVINIYGSSVNYEIAKAASYKLSTLGYTATAQSGANLQYIANSAKKKDKKPVSIILTHSDKNIEIIRIGKQLKNAGMPIISIVGSKNSDLGLLSDESLELYKTKDIFSLSSITYLVSLNYIFDLIYTCLFVSDFDFQKSNAVKSFLTSNFFDEK